MRVVPNPLSGFLNAQARQGSPFRDWVTRYSSLHPVSGVRCQLTNQQAKQLRAWFKEKEKDPGLTQENFCKPRRLSKSTFKHCYGKRKRFFEEPRVGMINLHEGSSMINMHEGSTGLLLHDSRKPKTVFQIYQDGLAQEQPMPPAFIQAAIVKAVSEIYQKNFAPRTLGFTAK